MRRVIGGLSAALLIGGLTLAGGAADASVRPCPTEDSVSCHWNAQTQGDGHGKSFTAYAHHRKVWGDVALTLSQVRRVERIVRHLPECKPDQPSGCREFVGHRHTLAVFEGDGKVYFVGLIRGRLNFEEVYA